jgi:hypothetical protein
MLGPRHAFAGVPFGGRCIRKTRGIMQAQKIKPVSNNANAGMM